jgi:hypothetical protein
MDTYGAIPFPLTPPLPGVEVADPAVTLVSQFAQAVLNTHGHSAYSAVVPAITGLQTGSGTVQNPVVRNAFEHDPAEEDFAERDLPAVYVFRNGGDRPYWLAEDYRVEEDAWTLLYLFQPAPQSARTRIKSFVNGVVKILDRSIESMREPSYVAPWDTDPTAGTTLPSPAALMQAVPSSTSAQVYMGPALNGTAGSAPFAPAQLPTVTVTGTPCFGEVDVVGVGSDGQPRISRVILAGTGTFVGDFQLQQVTEIDTPEQAGTTSMLSFGLGGYVGRGTNILLLGRLMRLEIAKWRQFRWTLQMSDGNPRRSYPHAVEVTLNVQERWIRDISGAPENALTAQYPTSGTYNDQVRETSIFSAG